MFNPNNIYTDLSGDRFLCNCSFNSAKEAEYVMASFLMSVREYFFPADLYVKENILVLDTPDYTKTKELAIMLNKSINDMY